MPLPTIDVQGKQIILLSGFDREARSAKSTPRTLTADAEKKLNQAALRNPDAVAFGYVAGKWIPAA